MANTDNINPKNILPVSPIKILAGWKLYFKKPKAAPAKAMELYITNEFALLKMPMRNNTNDMKNTVHGLPNNNI